MVFNYIIVEDETLSAQMLESMVKELRPDWNHLATFDSVADTTEWLQRNSHPNLIFLDIQLSDGLSFSIFDEVQVNSGIIFTTAYHEHAMRAFEVNSIDYILKPIKESALTKAIQKFEKAVSHFSNKPQQVLDYASLLKSLGVESKQYRKRFLVSRRDEMYTIPVEDVAYIYFENKITYAISFDGKRSILQFTLDKLEEELNPDMFIRANRQIIVNVKAISNLENYFGGKLIVKLLPELDFKFVVSRAKASSFKVWIDS